MSVTGYLALYTTLIGWQQYQNLWSLMTGTGLVFIPFIGIILNCFLKPFESQQPKSAAVAALQRLMVQIVGALLIIEFCCVPTVPLDPKVLHYEPACVASPKIATPEHTGTTYDNEFAVPTGIRVPIIWYLVMAVSNGFTHAAIDGLGCSPINYQSLQNQLDVSHISDPVLKNETIEFYNDCYVPAYSKYMSGKLSQSQNKTIQAYGQNDLGWVGSQGFLKTQGFYNALSAQQPIKGFAFNPSRDQFEGQTNNHSKWGEPNCAEWWSNPDNGLKRKLEKALPFSFIQKISHLNHPTELNEVAVRQLITNSFDPGMSTGDISQGYETLNDENGSGTLVNLVSDLGVAGENLSYAPKLYLIINALPVIQALLLLAIYALLAIMIPFSSYQTHFIITGAAIIFAVTFWSYLWHLVGYINNELIGALYPQNSHSLFPSWQELEQANGLNAVFVHFIIGTLYLVLPMLFLTLASWAGLKISGAVVGSMSQMQAPASAAGQEGAAIIKSGVEKAVKLIVSKAK